MATQSESWNVLERYAFAVALPIIATAITLSVPIINDDPFVLFVAAVAITAWIGGTYPGIAASLISVALTDYFLLPPLYGWKLASGDVVRCLFLVSVAILISYLVKQKSAAETQTAHILHSISEGCIILDGSWNFRYLNEQAARLLRKGKKELIGKNAWDMFPEFIGTRFEREYRRSMLDQVPVHFDEYYAPERAWYQVNAYPSKFRLTLFIHDVTEQRESQQRQREAEDRFRLAAEAGGIGFFDWEIETDSLTWNDNLFRISGVKKEDFTGKLEDLLKLTHPEDTEKVEKVITAAVQHGTPYIVEYRIVRPDGQIGYKQTRAVVIKDEKGEPRRIVGAVTDFTDRKKTEEAILRSEKLAAAGRLAGTIAHEINNPLEAVLNILYLLRAQPLDDYGQKLLSTAETEMLRASQITKQSLGFYRDPRSKSAVDVSASIEEVASIFSGKLQANGIHLVKSYSGACTVIGRPGDLHQIFTNLISNAIDAIGFRGTLRISTREHNGQVSITIQDSGVGMSPQVQSKIFEPFFTTKENVGTGLGLFVVKEIVTRYDGHVEVTSEVGKGTTFKLVFPSALNGSTLSLQHASGKAS
jgi:PAS domain S-box-containing protein